MYIYICIFFNIYTTAKKGGLPLGRKTNKPCLGCKVHVDIMLEVVRRANRVLDSFLLLPKPKERSDATALRPLLSLLLLWRRGGKLALHRDHLSVGRSCGCLLLLLHCLKLLQLLLWRHTEQCRLARDGCGCGCGCGCLMHDLRPGWWGCCY